MQAKKKSYVSASIGRCGSQLMTEAIHNHLWGFLDHPKPLLRKTRPFIREYPETFKNGTVYKTHLYPIEYPENCKVVFTFGNPLDIVLSVIRKSQEPVWGPAHFKNLGADWADASKIMQEDVLNLEKMFDAFYQDLGCDLMCVRYEALWDVEDQMSEFFGFEFKMPEKVDRIANKTKKLLTSEQIEIFNRGYVSLIEKINKAEDIRTWKRQ